MITDTDRDRLAELQLEAARLAGRGGLALDFGDWKRLHELERRGRLDTPPPTSANGCGAARSRRQK